MNEKTKKIVKYLEETTWSPINYLLEKFDADRSDVSNAVDEMLNKMEDVRVANDIIHIG